MFTQLKRVAALMICLAMLLSAMPAQALNFDSLKVPKLQTEAFVNPLYADVLSVEDIRKGQVGAITQSVTGSDGEEYCSTVEEAAPVIRQQLKQRVENVVVKITARDGEYNDLIMDSFYAAMDHTGVPTEGDYLLWQWAGCDPGFAEYAFEDDMWYFTVVYTMTYDTTAEQEAQVDAAVEELLTQLDLEGKSDYDKVCGVYDWMTANITYDYDNLYDDSYTLKYSAYAALIDRTAVCQGYALLLYRLLLELGVDCRIITGTGNGGGHAWNIVKLGGKYYNADATWDASWAQGGWDYQYFLRSDDTFGDHTRGEDYAAEEFYEAYPMGAADYMPGEETDYLTYDEAMLYVRQQLAKHMEGFTVSIQSETPLDEFFYVTMASEAMEHGVDPSLGDCANHDRLSWELENLTQWTQDGTYYYEVTYKTTSIITSAMQAELDAAIEEALAELDLWDKTDGQKVKGVWDYIAKNVTYDHENADSPSGVPVWGTAYGAMVNKTAVCAGYACLFYRMTMELGVDCRYISGWLLPITDVSHAWNIVRLGDVYYNVDSTSAQPLDYTYFVCTEEEFTLSHERGEWHSSEEFMAAYPMAQKPFVETVSGTFDNGVSWAVDGDTGLLTISGDGEMPEDEYAGTPWMHCFKGITGVVIEEGVTSIKERAFYEHSNLATVELPATLNHIGDEAFMGCGALKTINFPEGLESIGFQVFNGCHSLVSVVLPQSLQSVGDYAFSSCRSLRELLIPESVTSIGKGFLMNSPNVKEVNYPAGITTVPHLTFYDASGLEEIELKAVTEIGNQAFRDCVNLKAVTVRTDYFGRYDETAFQGCDNLRFIRFCGYVATGQYGKISDYADLTAVYLDHNWMAQWIDDADALGGLCADAMSVALAADAEEIGAYITDNYPITSQITYDGVEFILYADHDCQWSVVRQVTDGETTLDEWHCAVCSARKHTVGVSHDYTVESIVEATCTTDGYTVYVCSKCGDRYQDDYIYAFGHSYGDWYVSAEATCTAQGEKRRDCQNCDAYETAETAKKAHSYQTLYIKPTCTEDGYYKKTCETCDFCQIDVVEGSAAGHRYSEWYTYEEGTCCQTGEERRDCTICWTYESRTTELGDHAYETVVTAPTCTEAGYTTHTCKHCGVSYTDSYVDAAGHDHTLTDSREATCEEDGYEVYTCACGNSYTVTLTATGHSYESVVTEPTCTEQGYTTHSCACGHSYVDTYVDALGHDYVDGVCSRCDAAAITVTLEVIGAGGTMQFVTYPDQASVTLSPLASGSYSALDIFISIEPGYYAKSLKINGEEWDDSRHPFRGINARIDNDAPFEAGIPSFAPTGDTVITLELAEADRITIDYGDNRPVYTGRYADETEWHENGQYWVSETYNTVLCSAAAFVSQDGTQRVRELNTKPDGSGISVSADNYYFYYEPLAEYQNGQRDEITLYAIMECNAHVAYGAEDNAWEYHAAQLPTCVAEGNLEYRYCPNCNSYQIKDENGKWVYACYADIILPVGDHQHTVYTNNGDGTHTLQCAHCTDSVTEDHHYQDGICACGEAKYVLGDIDGNGEIDLMDANLAVGYYNETANLTDTQLLAADVNGDGEVDLMDANLIVGYYNETVDSFPAQN